MLDINGQYKGRLNEWNPFHSKFETALLLVEYGADVTAQDETHLTPLHLASFSGFPEIVGLLLECGASVAAQDESRRTPLHLASSWVSATQVTLFRNSADVNGQEMFSYDVKSKFQADTVKLLINYGADVTAQDETYQTPLHLATFSGSTETVQLLIEHGADVTAQDRRKKTPLHLVFSDVSHRFTSL